MQGMPRTRTFLAVDRRRRRVDRRERARRAWGRLPSNKGAGHPWAWRQVDGKRCWYKGKAGIDKKRLRWPKAATVGARPAKPLMIEPSGDDELLHTVWPPLDSFDNRFKGERK